MSRLRLFLTSLVLALVAASVLALPAAARTGPCFPGGPICHFWTAKVITVDDGDTIHVDVLGDGVQRSQKVRFSSVQAMEQSVYSHFASKRRGECHALEATARVDQLVRGSHWRVRLSAENPASHSGSRLRRWVAVRRNGRWADVGALEMREGHTLWMPGIVENAWNARYARLEQLAEHDHVGLWNPTHCGVGPDEQVPLRMWVNWDAPGRDTAANEWIKIENLSSTTPLPLGRWWVRDSMLRRLTFPAGTVLRPHGTITVHTGHGQATGTDFYWNFDLPIFENPGDSRHLGDGAYLFDPQGDLRKSFVYPCLAYCSDPDQGAIQITARPRRPEWMRLTNTSGHAVDLYGYRLTKPGYAYDFGPDSTLEPGQTLQIDGQGDPADDTHLERHWGIPHGMLDDFSDSIRLIRFDGLTLACDAWGGASC